MKSMSCKASRGRTPLGEPNPVDIHVGKRIRLRVTPEIKFVFSDGLEQGSRVLDLIEKISRGEIK